MCICVHVQFNIMYEAFIAIKVKVTQQQENGKEVTRRKLGKGDYFGEKALLG